MSVKSLIDIIWFEVKNMIDILFVIGRVASDRFLSLVHLVMLQMLFASVFLSQLPTSLHSPTTITALTIPVP